MSSYTAATGDGIGFGQLREGRGEGSIAGGGIEVEDDQMARHCATNEADIAEQSGLYPGADHLFVRWFLLKLNPTRQCRTFAVQRDNTQAERGIGQRCDGDTVMLRRLE